MNRATRAAIVRAVPPRPRRYPVFSLGQRVKAQARDQPNVWFDATVVGARFEAGGDPARALYDVRYEGYADQPQRLAVGKGLPVVMLQEAKPLRQLER